MQDLKLELVRVAEQKNSTMKGNARGGRLLLPARAPWGDAAARSAPAMSALPIRARESAPRACPRGAVQVVSYAPCQPGLQGALGGWQGG